jgi:hypothetical protein
MIRVPSTETLPFFAGATTRALKMGPDDLSNLMLQRFALTAYIVP